MKIHERCENTFEMRVLCYGDSLTAGTSPPLDTLHPYAPVLERALGSTTALVRHLGLPGWTASSMLQYANDEHGLNSLLKRGSPDLAIILAGTNDLSYTSDDQSILRALYGLHEMAHDLEVPTLAVGILPSAYQAQQAEAAELAISVNRGLREWCSTRGSMVPWRRTFAGGTIVKTGGGNGPWATYIEPPLSRWQRDDGLWAPDGLHLSPNGYTKLGEGLAGAVAQRLHSLRQT
jgi:lysophospholipase L1-like esterase